MIDNSFGHHQWVCGVGEKAANDALQCRQLGTELRRSFGIPVEPFLDELNLVAEVEGGGAEGRGIEGCFFEADRTI